jgi:hypothetical protein
MSLNDPFQVSQDLDEVWASRSVRPCSSFSVHAACVFEKQASAVKKDEKTRADSHSCQVTGDKSQILLLGLSVGG